MKFWYHFYTSSEYSRNIICGVLVTICITEIAYSAYQNNRVLDVFKIMDMPFLDQR